ncbi:LamG-like jellyroll fold domain-containing protein [Haloferula chungangensis]|uniref:LamG-like jellyroll fold domain-containing protein n=1 Tax=Haloferula chungangensis TaxID=1048331 RepID=A0ABW2L9T4_9BACT
MSLRLLVLCFVCFFSKTFGQNVVSSLSQLLPYLDDDNARVVMTPGTYRITPADVSSGLFSSNTLLNFTGHNSEFDFTGVTIEIDTRVFRSFGNIEVIEVALHGEDLVLRNLTLVDIGNTRPYRTALGVLLDGRRNLVEGFSLTVRGSYPYGYGDIFGKGTGYVIKHFKHSGILVRGDSNHLKNTSIFHRAYGHGIFCQGSLDAVIEGCYVEGEMRSSDEVLAEAGTGSPADDVDFETAWAQDPSAEDSPGYPLQPGWMFSLQEDGIRAYNAGTDPDGNPRNTRNLTVKDCTVKNMRSGVTIGFCDNTKYVEGCVSLGNESGFWVGSSGQIVNCSGNAQFGPVYQNNYQTDRNNVVDITILDNEETYGNHAVAYIGGSGHNLTFRRPDASVDQNMVIMVGGVRDGLREHVVNPTYNDLSTSSITLNNLSNYPVIMAAQSSGTRGQSAGKVTNRGSNNNLSTTALGGSRGFGILQTVQAEDFSAHDGVTIAPSPGGGSHVESIESGDWIRFDDFFLGVGPRRFLARVSNSPSGGSIQLRLGSPTGTLIGTCAVPASSHPTAWQTATLDLEQARGLHQLYLVFVGGTGPLMDLDSFRFDYWQLDPAKRDAEHLIGHWKLDDATGTFASDSSGKGNHGTIVGASWVEGVNQGALSFDGNNDRVVIPSSAFSTVDQEITIAMWVYGDGSQPLAGSTFYAANSSGSRVLNTHIPYSDSNLVWDAGNSSGYDRITRSVSADHYKGKWNHWTFTKNVSEGTMKAYHNGVLYKSAPNLSKGMSGIANAAFGGQLNAASYTGLIDEVRLYDIALTENEVVSLYTAGLGNVAPQAIAASARVMAGESIKLTLTGTDDSSEPLQYLVVDGPSQGSLSGTAPVLDYTPPPGFSGIDSFSFTVNDGELDSLPATVTITVWEKQLVAHWTLDEIDGATIPDSSGNKHSATLVSGTPVCGVKGGAIDFTGSSDSITLPATAFAEINEEITISFWAYGDTTQPRSDSIFYAVNGSSRALNIHLPWSDSKVYWDAGNTTGYDRISKAATNPEIKDQWNHWAFSKNAITGLMQIHLNGEPWSSDTGKNRLMGGITAATLGSQISGLGYEGMIDDVKLYNYAMSDAEAASAYADYRRPFDTWLAGFPDLNDTSWEGDPDRDGIPTGLEYVLNGNPELSDTSILPRASTDGLSFIFTFTRRVDSAEDSVQTFQFGSWLGDHWTNLSISPPTAPEVSFGPEIDGAQSVTITISRSLAIDGRLFGRLKAE